MTIQTHDCPKTEANPTAPEGKKIPFGANEVRLNLRQWLLALGIVVAFMLIVPWLWTRIERFNTGPDYRIPYALSNDYWLYRRRVDSIAPSAIPVLGDSVIWGEYVRPDGTLTHFLNAEAGAPGKFVNGGVNGLFPLSMEGLVTTYAGALTNRKVIVHCNVLWMSSPQADLSSDAEQTFNHASLVPQFFPRIPCYRADAATRLGAIAERHIGFFSWVNHLDSVYFGQQSIPRWTLAEDGGDPPSCPNAWRNPLAQITLQVPGEPKEDPQRGPTSMRHKPWTSGGAAPAHFDWVPLHDSLQWSAFQRTIRLLRNRGDDVLVILGPFNEYMVVAEQRPMLHQLQAEISGWLTASHVPHIEPATLPSDLYADDSHPLTDGYALLAKNIYRDPGFQSWLNTTK